jgi:hypothetical protein
MAVSYHSSGRWGSIKSVGWNEDGVAGVGLKPILNDDAEEFLGVIASECSACSAVQPLRGTGTEFSRLT